MFDTLLQNQAQTITFVMVDVSNAEVVGLGTSFVVNISKNGAAFAPGVGAKASLGHGWYSYTLTASETDTIGPMSIYVTGAGCSQQNLEYVVEVRSPNAIEFTYTVTDSVSMQPIASVTVSVTIDVAGNQVIWNGVTDAFGVARDTFGKKPRLTPGTYYWWLQKPGYIFTNPDTETVS